MGFFLSRAHGILSRAHEILQSRPRDTIKSCAGDTMLCPRVTKSDLGTD